MVASEMQQIQYVLAVYIHVLCTIEIITVKAKIVQNTCT